MKKFELIEHTADIGVKAYGKDLPELFANAAEGMFSIITDLKKVQTEEKYVIQKQANNKEELLISWLNELLFLFYTKEFLPKEFNIQIEDDTLKAEVRGRKYNSKEQEITREVKAATYHQLSIDKKAAWEASIIFDV